MIEMGEYKEKYPIELVHIDAISVGDTVFYANGYHTVGRNDIRYCSFMGKILFGSNYKSGLEPVKRAIVFRALADRFVHAAGGELTQSQKKKVEDFLKKPVDE